MSHISVYLTMLVAAMVGGVGITAFLDPAKAWDIFGMPATSRESIHLAYVFGARAIFISLTFIWLGLRGQRRIMGQLTIPWCFMVVLDCWAVYAFGLSGKLTGHVVGLCITFALGVWLRQEEERKVKA